MCYKSGKKSNICIFSNIWCEKYTNHWFSCGKLGEYYRVHTPSDISSSKSIASIVEKEIEKVQILLQQWKQLVRLSLKNDNSENGSASYLLQKKKWERCEQQCSLRYLQTHVQNMGLNKERKLVL